MCPSLPIPISLPVNRSHWPTDKQKLKFIFRNIRGIVHHKEGHWGGNEHGMDIGEGTTQGGTLGRYIEEGNLGGSNTG